MKSEHGLLAIADTLITSGTEASVAKKISVHQHQGYAMFILAPAWASYGRVWERIAASFLTLFILAAMIGLGTALGGAIVWFYDQYS